MDVTLLLMDKQSKHVLSPQKENGRYLKGDLVHVYPREKCLESPSPGCVYVFLHVDGVPTTSIEFMQNLLSEDIDQVATIAQSRKVRNARRLWCVREKDLHGSVVSALEKDKQATIKWEDLTGILYNKQTGKFVTEKDLG